MQERQKKNTIKRARVSTEIAVNLPTSGDNVKEESNDASDSTINTFRQYERETSHPLCDESFGNNVKN